MAWPSNTYLTQHPIFFALCLILFYGQHAFAAGNDIAENAALSSKKIHEEEDEIGYIQSLVVKLPAVVSIESSYQEIEVYDSHHFGRVFILDGCLQLTERDAHHYNEMLAHVPVMEYLARRDKAEPGEPLKVLVLGGGDGYVVSELLKHPHVGSIDHVEVCAAERSCQCVLLSHNLLLLSPLNYLQLDKEVITVAQQYLPWGDAWKSEKVNLVIADGAAFVKEQANKGKSYHVVIQDASDPFYLDADGSVVSLPSSVLYSTSHFESLHGLLQPDEGVLMFQAETYNIPSNLESIHKWRKILEDVGFASPRYGTISIGTYPTGKDSRAVRRRRLGKQS